MLILYRHKSHLKISSANGRLDSLEGKQISSTEKQKRYIYTTDSLEFKSRKLSTKGAHKILENGTSHEWYIQQVSKPLLIKMEFIGKDTLKITDGSNGTPAGYLVRISEIGIAHYQQGIIAEKQKQFALAFQDFSKAAKLQHPDEMYKLGMYYFSGTGTALSEQEGSKWIRAAANIGHAEAQSIVNSNSLRY